MAPSTKMASLEARQYYDGCPSNYYRSGAYCYPNSSWYWWGRWVLAGVVIFVVILIIVILSCVSARRRRKRGLQPMYGTGWLGGKHNAPYNNNQGYYNGGNQQNYAPPPPQYSAAQPQNTGNTYDSNNGYYGVNVQQPQNTYGNRGVGTDNVYEPPPGPPPSKVA
jgi:hypothetical protein